MITKIYNKVCYFVCKMLKITPCLCKHECGCKKEFKNEK
jgi:hypothetical protein